MDDFVVLDIELATSATLECTFYESKEECILKVHISGICTDGSQGEDYGAYLYEHIGLAILKVKPLAVLIDLQDLDYTYGTRILRVFQICDDIKMFDDLILTAFVLSDKNKFGLASLLQFDVQHPEPPIYYDVERATKELWEAYDAI